MLTTLNNNKEFLGEGNHALLFHIPGHCAGCKRVIGILETKELKDWTIYKVDAECDDNKDLISEYSVTTAPTIVTFKDGVQQEVIAGLKAFIERKEIFGP